MIKTINKKIELTVLTPLHIGDGNKLVKIDYFHDKFNKKVHIIDQNKWFEFLIDNNKIVEYQKYIESKIGGQNPNANNIDNFEFAKGIEGFILENSSIIIRSFDFDFSAKQGKKPIPCNDISPFMRDGLGHCYIAGSSIKGAIRSALLKLLLDKNKAIRKSFELRLKSIKPESNDKKHNRYRREVEKATKDLEKQLITFNTREPNKNAYISVSDAYRKNKTECQTFLKQDFDWFLELDGESNKESKKMPNIREYIKPGSKFYFDLSFDNDFLEKEGFTDIEKLLKDIGNCTNNLFLDEYSPFLGEGKKIYKNSLDIMKLESIDIPIILGANTGYHQKTITWNLFDDCHDAIDVIKYSLHKGDTKISSHIEDLDFSPRMLNTVKVNNKDVIAGLVGLKVID